MTTTDIPKPMDPLYNRPQSTAKRAPLDNPAEYNRWRASLPEQCWLCAYYDKCSPTHKCRHQVDIDVQAQLPTKGG